MSTERMMPAPTAADGAGTGERTYRSETAKHRDVLGPYCGGCGVDVGFGGDPITPAAVRMDLPQPYARTGDALPVQLGGDCRDLFWFRNDVLDFLYSSHVLEDFGRDQTVPILREWARVLRPGALMILLQPEQVRYVHYCQRRGLKPNAHHSIENFSLDYVKRAVREVGGLEVVAEYPAMDEYSFAIVFCKARPTAAGPAELDNVRGQLHEAWGARDELARRARLLELKVQAIERSRALRLSRAIRRLIGG